MFTHSISPYRLTYTFETLFDRNEVAYENKHSMILLGKLLQNLDIRTLVPLDIPVVISDHPPTVDVVGQPSKVNQSCKDPL